MLTDLRLLALCHRDDPRFGLDPGVETGLVIRSPSEFKRAPEMVLFATAWAAEWGRRGCRTFKPTLADVEFWSTRQPPAEHDDHPQHDFFAIELPNNALTMLSRTNDFEPIRAVTVFYSQRQRRWSFVAYADTVEYSQLSSDREHLIAGQGERPHAFTEVLKLHAHDRETARRISWIVLHASDALA